MQKTAINTRLKYNLFYSLDLTEAWQSQPRNNPSITDDILGSACLFMKLFVIWGLQ